MSLLDNILSPQYAFAPGNSPPAGDCGCGTNDMVNPQSGPCDSYNNPPYDPNAEQAYPSPLGNVVRNALPAQNVLPGYSPLPAYVPNPLSLRQGAYMGPGAVQYPSLQVQAYRGGCSPKAVTGLVLLPPTLPAPPLYNKGATVQFYDEMQSTGYEPCAQMSGLMPVAPAPQGVLNIVPGT